MSTIKLLPCPVNELPPSYPPASDGELSKDLPIKVGYESDDDEDFLSLDELLEQARLRRMTTTGSGSQDDPITIEQPRLEDSNPNAPYYVQLIPSDDCTNLQVDHHSPAEIASTRGHLRGQTDLLQKEFEQVASKASLTDDGPISEVLEVVMDTSQPKIATTCSERLSRKRSHANSKASLQSKRPRHAKHVSITSTKVQGWVVVGLGAVELKGDGSAHCSLQWADTEIDEAEIKDERLRAQFREHFKSRYGEDEWKRWIDKDSVRSRRYGRESM